VGLAVYDGTGTHIGRVADTFETPAHEVLVVRGDEAAERYVPFTYEQVPTVDLEQGRIVVNLPEAE
jgi:16S rRNA processing protein RimM